MLKVLKEIDKVKKERTYFHQIPESKELTGTTNTEGKVINKKSAVILTSEEIEEKEVEFYKKISTILTYKPSNFKFNRWEERYIIQQSLKDTDFSELIKYIKGIAEVDEAKVTEWKERVQEIVINSGKVFDVTGKSVVVVDDGIESINCIVNDDQNVQEGKVYDMDLVNNSFKKDNHLVLGEDIEKLYEIDKIQEL